MPNSETRKVVVLARGLGTRMKADAPEAEMTDEQRRAADAGMKAMIPIGRPFLDHCLSAYADAGFTEACLVIGPEHDAVRDYYASLETTRMTITTAIQPEPLGTADAVLAAEEFVAGERFVMVNGDNYYPSEVMRAVREASGHVSAGFDREALVAGSNIPAERLRAFALLVTDGSDALREIIEKPTAQQYAELAADARVSMNCFGFAATVFDAARRVQPSSRGEYEIVDAVRELVVAGEPVRVVPVAAGVLDMSNRGDVAAVADRLEDSPVHL